MSDDNTNESSETREPSEMEVLKDRARKMGIIFSNNIGLETLRQKVNDKMNGVVSEPEKKTEPELPKDDESAVEKLRASLAQPGEGPDLEKAAALQANPLVGQTEAPKVVKTPTLRQYMIQEQMKLVRLRIQCLDPKKKELQGEVFTVANEHLGTVKKFVPFGEVTDEGFHVPYCIYEFMKNRKFLNIVVRKGRDGKETVSQRWAQEFSLEVLPQLTRDEIDKLAAAQAAAGGLD